MPTKVQLRSRASMGLGVLQLWEVDSGDGRKTKTWMEGAIVRAPRGPKSHYHRVRYLDGELRDVKFLSSLFTVVADPSSLPLASFSLFGSVKQLAALGTVVM